MRQVAPPGGFQEGAVQMRFPSPVVRPDVVGVPDHTTSNHSRIVNAIG
jgi:hypothetical protein